MLRRNLNSDFVGGAYVFPGGAVDDHDRHDEPRPGLSRPYRRRGLASSSASSAVGWPSGSPRSARASRRPACCSRTTGPTDVDPSSTSPAPRSASSSTDAPSTPASVASSTSARTSTCSSRSTTCTTSATGSPRGRTASLRHPLLRGPSARGARAAARRPRGHRQPVDPAVRSHSNATAPASSTSSSRRCAASQALERFATADDVLAAAEAIQSVPTILPRTRRGQRRLSHRAPRRCGLRRDRARRPSPGHPDEQARAHESRAVPT